MARVSPHNFGKQGLVSLGDQSIPSIRNASDAACHNFAIAIYRNDADATEAPHDFWFHRVSGTDEGWTRCSKKPDFHPGRDYKYDPPTELVQTYTMPRTGDKYWCVNLLVPELLHQGIWEGSKQQLNWYQKGLVFISPSRAIAAAREALIGIQGTPK